MGQLSGTPSESLRCPNTPAWQRPAVLLCCQPVSADAETCGGRCYGLVCQGAAEAHVSCKRRCSSAMQAAKLCGASVDREQAYPGWMPAPSSPVVQLTKQCLQSLIGHEPKVRATRHASSRRKHDGMSRETLHLPALRCS